MKKAIIANVKRLTMILLLLISACTEDNTTSNGEDSGTSSNEAGGGGGSNAPTTVLSADWEAASTDLSCDIGTIRVDVTTESGTFTKTFYGVARQFRNAMGDNSGNLGVSGDAVTFSVFFDRVVAYGGESKPARGSISNETFNLGNCDADGNPGTLTLNEDGQGGIVVLKELREEPYCEGAEVAWTIEICFRHR